jgi:hypothetical protein
MIGPLGYLLDAGMAWLSVSLGFLMYVVTPLFFITPPSAGPGAVSFRRPAK